MMSFGYSNKTDCNNTSANIINCLINSRSELAKDIKSLMSTFGPGDLNSGIAHMTCLSVADNNAGKWIGHLIWPIYV